MINKNIFYRQNETIDFKEGNNGFYVNLDCAASTTIQRSQFLQDRIRECASSGCQNSKL